MREARSFKIVIAPDISSKQVEALRTQYDKEELAIVKNYDVHLYDVRVRSNELLFVIAKKIPAQEVKSLRYHVAQALADPDYVVMTNYDLDFFTVPISKAQHRLLVVAPGIPDKEVKVLDKDVRMALGKPFCAVVTNYPLDVTLV